MKALLVVDVQNDFCTGGALAVREGEQVVPAINRLMTNFNLVVASKDWHPANSQHFKKWPKHCVQDTYGAAFYPQLNDGEDRHHLSKGDWGERRRIFRL